MKPAEVRFVGPTAFVDPWIKAAGPDLTAYSHEDDTKSDIRLQTAYFVMDRACLSLMAPATQADDAQLTSAYGPRPQYHNEAFHGMIKAPLSDNHLGWDIAWGNPKAHFRSNVPLTAPMAAEVYSVYDRKPSNSGLYMRATPTDHMSGLVINYHHTDPLIRPTLGRATPVVPGTLVGTVQPHGNDPHLHLAALVPHSLKSAYINHPVGELDSDRKFALSMSPYYLWGWEHLVVLPRRMLLNFLFIAEGPFSPIGVLHTAALAMVFADTRKYPENHIRTKIARACAFWFGVWKWGRFDLNPNVVRNIKTIPYDDPSSSRLWNPLVGSSVLDSRRLSDVTEPPGSAYASDEESVALRDTLSIAYSLICPQLGSNKRAIAADVPLYPEAEHDDPLFPNMRSSLLSDEQVAYNAEGSPMVSNDYWKLVQSAYYKKEPSTTQPTIRPHESAIDEAKKMIESMFGTSLPSGNGNT